MVPKVRPAGRVGDMVRKVRPTGRVGDMVRKVRPTGRVGDMVRKVRPAWIGAWQSEGPTTRNRKETRLSGFGGRGNREHFSFQWPAIAL
jgi:hypothetical protein